MFGVDLSSVQQPTNYAALKAAIDFAYLRVFRSNGLEDSAWRTHYDNLAGRPRAPYLFLMPSSQMSVAKQVATFLSWANTVSWEWGPVFDCEFAGITAADIAAVVSEWRKQTSKTLCYVYASETDLKNACNPSLWCTDKYMRIIAARYYTNDQVKAFTNLAWDHPNLDITQYWNQGSVPGVPGKVDLNTARQILMGTDTVTEQTDIALDYTGKANYLDSKGNPILVCGVAEGTNQGTWANNAILQALATHLDALTTAVANIGTAVNADTQILDQAGAGLQEILTAIQNLPKPELNGSFVITGNGTVGTPSSSATSGPTSTTSA